MLIIFLVLVVLLSPALIWRLRLAGEVNQLVANHRAQGRLLNVEQVHSGADAIAEEENGAGDILAAAKDFQTVSQRQVERLPFFPGQPRPSLENISTEAWSTMTALVAANEEVLLRVDAGANKSEIRYGGDDLTGDALSSHVDSVSHLVVLLCCDAVLAAEAKDTVSAWSALNTALAVTRSLGANADLERLYRQWELETQLLYALQWVLGACPPVADELAEFTTYVSRARRIRQWQRACDGELTRFVERMGHREDRSLFRAFLLAAGVGDLNLKAAFALYEPMRAGFGLSRVEQLPFEKAYYAVQANVQDHGLIYATVVRRHAPPYWDVLRHAWAEVVVAELALAVEMYRVTHGSYPGEAWVHEKAVETGLSDEGVLAYSAGPGSCALELQGENGSVLNRWVVGVDAPVGLE